LKRYHPFPKVSLSYLMISTCFLSPLYLSQSHPSNITIPLSLLHIESNGVYIQKQFVAAFSVLFITYKYTSEQKFCHLSRIWVIYCGTVTMQFIWNFQRKQPTKQALEETEGGITSSNIGMGPVFSSLAMSEEGVGEEGYVNPNRAIDLPTQICNNEHLITI
jgi:hypothetical protein